MISRNDPCWCGSGKKWKKCHYPQEERLSYDQLKSEYKRKYNILLKSPEEIIGIRKACRFAAATLKKLCAMTKEGVTTKELDRAAQKFCEQENAISASLGYGTPPFPGAICTSLNEVICHGIPNETPLKSGDILNIDFACILNGFYGDCSAMVCIGDVEKEKKLVVDVAYESMMKAIAILKPGIKLYEIGETIESYATSKGCSVVNAFVSHGVGLYFHEEPQIPHCYNKLSIPLAEGMTFTIEPMINAGVREAIIDKTDKWTARTADRKPSAQWEHTVLITKNGHEILTIP